MTSLFYVGEVRDLCGRFKQGVVKSIAIKVAGLADPDLGG